MAKMTPAGKGVILLLTIGALVAGKFFWYDKRPKAVQASILSTAGDVAIPDAPEASLSGPDAKKLPFPSKDVAGGSIKGTHYDMGWQSATGFNYANGGPQTTKGSIFASFGLNISIERQTDCMQSQAKVAQFCKDYKDNPGTPFVMATYMGSGIPGALYNISQATKDLPEEYQPVVVMTFGKSYGEDQLMGHPRYKADKTKLRGCVIVAVRLDGDADLGLKLGGSFGIPVNPDPSTYDPDAINFKYVASYTDAAKEYNSNVTETRHIVKNGKTIGRDTTVGIDIVATWTPGDVTVHNGPRGSQTVSIISTKEYASIMPAMTITCRKWYMDHIDVVANIITGCAIAGDQIRSFEDVKRYACGLNAEIYKEESGDYWYKYYNGVKIPTLMPDGTTDSSNHLGGSMVFNLADMANMMGIMIPGKTDNNDIYGAVYNTFGALQHKYYPNDLVSVMPYEKAVDKTALLKVISSHPELLRGKAALPNYNATMTNKIGNRAWHIEFDFGSDQISDVSSSAIEEIYNEITSTDGSKVKLIGHTDNVGNPESNQALSERRARSVMNRLIQRGLTSDRFFSPEGRGSKEPVTTNATDDGRAQNRRVQITILTQ